MGSLAVVLAGSGLWVSAAAKKSKRPARTREVPALTRDGRPNVQSDAALVVDSRDGTILYEKNPDKVRAIASTGR